MALLLVGLIELTFVNILLMISFGILVGIVTSIGGIGGGSIIMPILLIIFNMEYSVAKGTSIFLILVSSGIATIYNIRKNKIHLPSILFMSLIGMGGSLVCFLLQRFLTIEENLFFFLFGVYELIIAIHMLNKAKSEIKNPPLPGQSRNEETAAQKKSSLFDNKWRISVLHKKEDVIKAIPFFFLAGFLTTFFGIGGGPITTPVFHEILHLPIYNATAASSALFFFTSLVNCLYYGIRGEIEWIVGIIIGLGMMIGSYGGAMISNRLTKSSFYLIIGSLFGILGTIMILGILS